MSGRKMDFFEISEKESALILAALTTVGLQGVESMVKDMMQNKALPNRERVESIAETFELAIRVAKAINLPNDDMVLWAIKINARSARLMLEEIDNDKGTEQDVLEALEHIRKGVVQ